MELGFRNLRGGAPSDLTCLDFGATGVKVVRLKRSKDAVGVLGVDILPPVDLSSSSPARLPLPKALRANYAAVSIGGGKSIANLVAIQQQTNSTKVDGQIKDQLGITDEFRLSYVELSSARSKSGLKLLAAATLETEIKNILSITAHDPPAPCSCEIAPLSALTAFQHGNDKDAQDGGCFLEIGATTTYIFFTNRRKLLLLRRYDVGGQMILEHIINEFQVDIDTAGEMMTEGAFDLSPIYLDTLGFLVRQITISRDFVERQENCHIAGIKISGGAATSRWAEIVQNKTGIETQILNPFETLNVPPDADYKNLMLTQSCRFSAAVGAGLGVFGQ
jgi:Tfp pilus assembly PilM family ATPase